MLLVLAGSSLQAIAAASVSTVDWPTASCSGTATRSGCASVAVSPATTTVTGTGPVGVQGRAVAVGTVIIRVVGVAATTVAAVPLTETALSVATDEKLLPEIVTAP